MYRNYKIKTNTKRKRRDSADDHEEPPYETKRDLLCELAINIPKVCVVCNPLHTGLCHRFIITWPSYQYHVTYAVQLKVVVPFQNESYFNDRCYPVLKKSIQRRIYGRIQTINYMMYFKLCPGMTGIRVWNF